MIYIKPDMKNKKKSLNDINEEKIKTDIRQKTNRTRGKSINQRVKKRKRKKKKRKRIKIAKEKRPKKI